MRLWASLDTITFGEYAPRLGEVVEPSFTLTPSYVGPVRSPARRPRFPIDLTALGEAGPVQVPELGRTITALAGTLARGDEEARREAWLVESALTVRLGPLGRGTLNGLVDRAAAGERPACQALGELSIAGRELRLRGDVPQAARLVRFQSLFLRAGDPRFGQWADVQRYGDLGSDPDVIGVPVLVAELEILP